MNKTEWDARSRQLGVPCRCPIYEYCVRKVMSEYAYDSVGLSHVDEESALYSAEISGKLPRKMSQKEFGYHKIDIVNEEENPVSLFMAGEIYASGVCPDYMLHELEFTADGLPEPLALTHVTIESDSPESGWVVPGTIKASHYTNCEEYLSRYPKMRKKVAKKIIRDVPRSVRFLVLRRDGFCCKYCGRRGANDGTGLEADHLISLCDGGTNDPSNLIAACEDCNRGKGRKSVSPSELHISRATGDRNE